jgi:hypothetical protein
VVVAIVGGRLGRALGIAVQIPDFLFQVPLQLVRGAAEFPQTFAEHSRDVWKLLGPKQQKGDEKYKPDLDKSAAKQD